jgi:excisionase family DNA binding protein
VAQKQTYTLKPIRRDYTYSVEEIAELYGITPDTVFRWIRNEGLRRIEASKKYFVHGSELAKFLEQRNVKNKKPCKEGEIYCCKCRQGKPPKPYTLKIKKLPNKTLRVFAKCSVCDARMNTVVSGKKWTENHPFYPDKNASTKPHSGESESQRKCQTQAREQLCPNITP